MQEVPAGFEELAPFVAQWGLATEKERHRKRVGSRLEDVRSFYQAMTPRIHDTIAHLSSFPGADPDDVTVLRCPTLMVDAQGRRALAERVLELARAMAA